MVGSVPQAEGVYNDLLDRYKPAPAPSEVDAFLASLGQQQQTAAAGGRGQGQEQGLGEGEGQGAFSNRQLGLVHLMRMRFCRRVKGIEASRKAFTQVRVRRRIIRALWIRVQVGT